MSDESILPLGFFDNFFINNEPLNCRRRIDLVYSAKEIDFITKIVRSVYSRKAVAECKMYYDLGFVDTRNMEN